MALRVPKAPRVIKVGSDFCGLGTVSVALGRMLPMNKFKMLFQSDLLDASQRLAELSPHKTETFHKDVLDRNQDELPYTDVYVWTPPCQSFSLAGNLKKHERIHTGQKTHSQTSFLQEIKEEPI